MPRHEFDKATTNLLLEAVRGVVGHLSRMRLLPDGLRPADDRELVSTYGHARRLLGYMQQAGRTYDAQVLMGLEGADLQLLVGCVVFELGRIEEQLSNGPLNEKRSGFLEASRSALEAVARELAEGPVHSIPGDPNASRPRSRGLARELQRAAALANGAAGDSGDPLFGSTPASLSEPRGGGRGGGDSELPRTPAGSTAAGRPAAPAATAADAVAAANGLAAPQGLNSTVGLAPRPSVPLRLIDPKRIRNERLRSLAVLDQEAWRRSISHRDLRAAAVHLEALVEAVMIDQALPRASELGLRGMPGTWPLSELIARLVPDLDVLTRSRVQLLVRCRDLVRPAMQLESPLPVNASLLAELAAVAMRIFSVLGLRENLEPV